jgi:hypothetical protein
MKFPLSFVLIMIFACKGSYSQKLDMDTTQNCLDVIKEVSYYWKLDSLANNGFRLSTHEKFLECKPDKIYADVLLNTLGKPNEIRKTNKGTEYLYYYFDIKSMPKDYSGPSACWYLSFKFENEENFLSSIEKGDIDR